MVELVTGGAVRDGAVHVAGDDKIDKRALRRAEQDHVMHPEDLDARQREVCECYGSVFVASPAHLTVGISENAKQELMPLNGLRHQPGHGTTGWFIWRGEDLSESSDFFVPLCVAHLETWCAEALPFLGLAPGWRFLKAGDYVDVWFDETLVD